MRPLLLGLMLALGAALAPATTALAETTPDFRLGFKALAHQIPEIVGQPLDNEQYDPASGDSIQRTSRGLMVWRREDNITAFTDGTTTWLDGPLGLQSRPNSIQFDWEGVGRETPLPDSAVTLNFSRSRGGNWVAYGAVRNILGQPMDVEINAVGFGPSGSPLIDVPTLFLRGIPPGATRPITMETEINTGSARWRWIVTSHPSSERTRLALDVGTSKRLQVDPALEGTVVELRKVTGGEWLVRVAAENGVAVAEGALPPGVLGEFVPSQRLVTISSELGRSSSWVRASVLAHELQHAADAASGNSPRTPAQCLAAESNAFRRQTAVWNQLWQTKLPADADSLHAELNDITRTINHNPELFAAELADRYRSECGPLP